MPSPSFKLIPATPADEAFARAVEEDAIRGYVEQTWGQWDPAQSPTFEAERHCVIQMDGRAAGIMAVDRFDDHLFLAKLYLLTAFQNSGVGLLALNAVTAEADARRIPVRLRVLPVNVRAQAFYLRHGFVVESERDGRIYMMRAPATRVESPRSS